jgi:hypothetical protein
MNSYSGVLGDNFWYFIAFYFNGVNSLNESKLSKLFGDFKSLASNIGNYDLFGVFAKSFTWTMLLRETWSIFVSVNTGEGSTNYSSF